MLTILKSYFFNCDVGTWFSTKVTLTYAFLVSIAGKQSKYIHYKNCEKLTFLNIEKRIISSTLLIRERFQGYRCELDISIFAWCVT